MAEVITTITSFVTNYFDVALAVVGVLALVATKTPNTSDDKIVQFVLDLVNFGGANFGKAKNNGD